MNGVECATATKPGDGELPMAAIAGLRNVFLIGLMGAGKTTVGRHLARLLGFEFVDADHEIETHTGATIPLIFEIEGEEGFRKREAAAIAELVKREHMVLATGGGAILLPENRAALRTHGTVVYLRAELETLLSRTSRSNHRPLLNSGDPRTRLEELLRNREPLYRDTADLIVETGRGSAPSVAKKIVTRLKERALA